MSGPRLRLRLRYRTGQLRVFFCEKSGPQPRAFSSNLPLSPAPALRCAARLMASLLRREPHSLLRSQLPREHDGVSGPRLRLRLRCRAGQLRMFFCEKSGPQPRAFFGKEALSPAAALRYAARLMASLLCREICSFWSRGVIAKQKFCRTVANGF